MASDSPSSSSPAPDTNSRESGRGREARKPSDVPTPGWRDILSRTKQQLDEDNLSIVAAGVAFYAFVAVVPALAATISLYALLADTSVLTRDLETMARIMPHEVMPLLQEQMKRIATNDTAAGWGAVIGIVLALYSSAKATKAIIIGLNIAYDERERRGFVKLTLQSLALTLGAIVGVLVVIGLMSVVPLLLRWAHIPSGVEQLLGWLRWPCLVAIFMVGLSIVYRFGPSRDSPKWRWVTWGAGLATLLWIIGSAAFSFYVSKFGSYEKTYGSLGAVVIFLLWLYITAYVVLLGAELNSEMERQTKQDTTKGAPKPLGHRGAYAADTVGPSKK